MFVYFQFPKSLIGTAPFPLGIVKIHCHTHTAPLTLLCPCWNVQMKHDLEHTIVANPNTTERAVIKPRADSAPLNTRHLRYADNVHLY